MYYFVLLCLSLVVGAVGGNIMLLLVDVLSVVLRVVLGVVVAVVVVVVLVV